MRRIVARLACPLLLCAAAAAQDFGFTINQGLSNWNWSGTTSLGPLEGNPSTAFQLAGSFAMDLGAGGAPIGSGRVVTANAMVVPDLHGRVPNPVPILPPLALVDVTNLSFSYSTNTFSVAPGGAFTATWTATILTGTLTVTPLVGSPTVTNLAGTSGTPASNPGTLTQAGAVITLNSPQTATFAFTDPTSGISATLTITGTLRGTSALPAPAPYCVASPNSVGPGTQIGWSGSVGVTANDLSLQGTGAPPFQFGVFYYGPNQINLPFGDGVRCVGGGVFRLGVLNSGAGGVFTKDVDYGNVQPGGEIEPGDTWNFQCWYRDPAGGPAGFNFSNGLEIFFWP